jgi:hypothetical protein
LTKLKLAQVYVTPLAGLPQNVISLLCNNTIDSQNASLLPPRIKTLRAQSVTGGALGLLPTSLTSLACGWRLEQGLTRKRLIGVMKVYPSLSFFHTGVNLVFNSRLDDGMLAFYQEITRHFPNQ